MVKEEKITLHGYGWYDEIDTKDLKFLVIRKQFEEDNPQYNTGNSFSPTIGKWDIFKNPDSWLDSNIAWGKHNPPKDEVEKVLGKQSENSRYVIQNRIAYGVTRLLIISNKQEKCIDVIVYGLGAGIGRALKLLKQPQWKNANWSVVSLDKTKAILDRHDIENIWIYKNGWEVLPGDIQQKIYKRLTGKDKPRDQFNGPDDLEWKYNSNTKYPEEFNEPTKKRVEIRRKEREEADAQEKIRQAEIKRKQAEAWQKQVDAEQPRAKELFFNDPDIIAARKEHAKIFNYSWDCPVEDIPFHSWGYENGMSKETASQYRIESKLHNLVRWLSPENHDYRVTRSRSGNQEDGKCSCGFSWGVDMS